MPCTDAQPLAGRMPAWGDEAETLTTAALLRERFGDVLIPLEDVRKAYFRNRSADRFRRALREGVIPLPVVRLDASYKGQGFICLWQLAAYIDWHAEQAALRFEAKDCSRMHHHRLHRALIEATPTPAPATAPRS
ncbi:MAG: pyocin activator PrtN family protein [Pseudomonadota bacterium]